MTPTRRTVVPARTPSTRLHRAARRVAPVLAVGALAAAPAAASADASLTAPDATGTSSSLVTTQAQTAPPKGSPISRASVIHRSGFWIQRRVPYSQSSYTDGYRQDCSGYVSLSWHLDGSPNSTTLRSSAYTTVIPKRALQAGDALGRPGHIALFVRWGANGTAVMREQYKTGRTAEQRTWSAKRVADHTAYRYKKIR